MNSTSPPPSLFHQTQFENMVNNILDTFYSGEQEGLASGSEVKVKVINCDKALTHRHTDSQTYRAFVQGLLRVHLLCVHLKVI